MVTGFRSIARATGVPSPVVGGYLWENYYPALTLQMTFIIGIIPALILYLFVKEPEIKEK